MASLPRIAHAGAPRCVVSPTPPASTFPILPQPIARYSSLALLLTPLYTHPHSSTCRPCLYTLFDPRVSIYGYYSTRGSPPDLFLGPLRSRLRRRPPSAAGGGRCRGRAARSCPKSRPASWAPAGASHCCGFVRTHSPIRRLTHTQHTEQIPNHHDQLTSPNE